MCDRERREERKKRESESAEREKERERRRKNRWENQSFYATKWNIISRECSMYRSLFLLSIFFFFILIHLAAQLLSSNKSVL